MHGAPEFQVTAESHGEVFKPALLAINGQQVCQRLGGMIVPAVPGIYDGDARVHCGDQRRTLLGVAHGDDVGVAADNLCRVGNAFSLGGRGALGFGEADHVSAELIHGGLKTQPGAGGGFKEQGGELLSAAEPAVGLGPGDDVVCGVNQLLKLFRAEIKNVNQASLHTLLQLSSEGLFRKAISRFTSSGRI